MNLTLNWYKLSQKSPQTEEKQFYTQLGTDFLFSLKSLIQSDIGGKFKTIKYRYCITTPSNVKWYEKEHNLNDKYLEMSRLQAEISEIPGTPNTYIIAIFINVNKNSQFLFTGDVYEKNYSPDYHKFLDEHQKNSPSYDISNVIMKSQADKIPLGFFGNTIIPENFKIQLGSAKSPEETVKKIKTIILSSQTQMPTQQDNNTPQETNEEYGSFDPDEMEKHFGT